MRDVNKVWKIWLGLCAVAIVAYFTILPGVHYGSQIDYLLLSFGAAVAIVLGVRLHRPARPWVWYLLASGIISWALGDSIWQGLAAFGNTPTTFPSIADPFYLLAYPAFGVALLLARGRRSSVSRAGDVLEAAIVTLGASLLSWILVMRPYITDPSVGTLGKIVSIAYPLGDLLLVAVVVPMIGGGVRRSASTRFLMGWLGFVLAADSIYLVMVSHNTYVSGSWIDGGWLIGYLLVGAAALHPSMAATRREEQDVVSPSISRLRLALIAMASIAGPLVIIIEAMQRRWSDVALTAGGGMLLAALVLVRLMTLVGEANARRSELDLAMDQVSFLALHDPLTNLANRTLFSDRMEQVSVRARRHPSSAAVLLFDLDDFKAINDGMGHHVGDLLLTTVAERLLAATRDCDTVARLGGDEFAVLVDDLDRSGRAVQVAERILSAMTEPILGEDHMFVASGSIGIAEHDPMGDASDTMRHADLAMYAAKRRGKGRFVLFTPEMGDAALSPA